MTKKHLIFPIHTYPDDVPKKRKRFLLVCDGKLYGPYTMGSASGLLSGDQFIILSEGEVVEVEQCTGTFGCFRNYLKYIKEQEGDE